MVTRLGYVVMILTSFQLVSILGCNKNRTSCISTNATYSFSVSSKWSPQREIYRVGDTIYFNSSFPKLLMDNIGNTQINYANSVSLGGTITMSQLDTIMRRSIPARTKFNIISVTGGIQELPNSPQNGTANSYQETGTNCQCKVGFICKEKGIFGFGVSDLLSSGLRGINCTKAGFSMTVINSEKNFGLYLYALGFAPDADGSRRGYCFRVQ